MKILKIVNNLNQKIFFKLSLIILSILVVSCEKDFVDTINSPEEIISSRPTSPTQQGQNKMLDVPTGEADVNSVKLHKNVIVLNETANSQMISYADDKIEFILHESVKNIQVGDVLNSAPSTLAKYGLLVRVLNKEVKNGKIILQVEPGDIDDLFEEADFSFNTEKGLTLRQSQKRDFSFDLDFGAEISYNGDVNASKISAQIAGRLDFTFDFKTHRIGDPTDNYLRTRMNIHLDRDNNNPDLVITLSQGFEALIVDDRLLGVITAFVGGAFIPFSINADAGAEIQFDFGVSTGALGLDLHGDIGFERTTIGGHGTEPTSSENWNTMGHTFKLDLNPSQLANFSAQLIAPKIEVRVTPFKPLSDAFEITPISLFAGVYVTGDLGFNLGTSCLTYSDPMFGFEGGIKGNFKKAEYQVSASKEYDLGDIKWDLWCDNGTGSATTGTFSFDMVGNVIQEAKPNYTIKNSSGLHMAEGLHGKKIVFKSMKDRDSNTEDHNLLYSTNPDDVAGRYLTIVSPPDGNYYNPNYKVLGVSNYASDDVVFKLFATDNGRYLIKGANGKFADLHVGSSNPNNHQKFIEFNRTYNEAKTKDDCKFQILMHEHKPGHYFIYKMDKGYLTPKINNPARLKLVTRSKEQEFIMMDADEVTTGGLESEVRDVSFQSVSDGDWLVAESYGNDYAYCNRNSIGAWEKFDIMMAPDLTFAIRAQANGKYATVNASDKSRIKFTQTDRFNSNCRFRFVDHPSGNGYKAIQFVKTEKYLTCKGSYDDSPLEANRDKMSTWERWRIEIPEL